MGRRIIQAKASNILDRLQVSGTNGDADDADLHSLMQDAEEKYLCNIPPHRSRSKPFVVWILRVEENLSWIEWGTRYQAVD